MSGRIFNFFGVFTIDLPKQNRSLGKLPGLLLSDVALIAGVGIGLVLILALAIYGWRRWHQKRRRHVSSGEKVYRGSSTPEASDDESGTSLEDEDSPHGRRRYKYRVRRRGHRGRNPTLSETGGLPPVKTQEPTKPV